jgi:hypothetical protein
MAQKAGVVFKEHDEVRLFLRSRNHVVEKWLDGAVHKSTVSRALTGQPVSEELVGSLTAMLEEMRHDPWVWCEPPERIEDVEGLQEYAPYKWWFDLLRPTVVFSRFERMPKHPLPEDELEFLQERLSAWRSRLRAACDQYKSDHALVEALRADMNPEYQNWVQEDTGWRLGSRRPGQYGETHRQRVGNHGLHGRSADEIALAHALARVTRRLPLIEEARLAYDRTQIVTGMGSISAPVEPWNGDTFEGVEWTDWEDFRTKDEGNRPKYLEAEHRVLYCWDGSRYQVRDIGEGEGMFARVRTSKWEPWQVPSAREREMFATRVERRHDTVEEFLANRDQWIADCWESKKAEWSGPGIGGFVTRQAKPDGIPESEAIAAFENALEHLRSSLDAREERELIARRLVEFRNKLRR